jgi:hypothetical protein
MNHKEIKCQVVDWTHLAQDSVQWWNIDSTTIEPEGALEGVTFLCSIAVFLGIEIEPCCELQR